MPPPGGIKTPIEPGLVARLAGAAGAVVGTMIRGAADAWMGPGQPMQPVAAKDSDVRGRAFDYPFAVNTQQRPRGEGQNPISFAVLRALADPAEGGLDVLRIAIEKRKDQLASQEWSVKGRDGSDGGPKARAIEEAMRQPDGANDYDQWVRMLAEDLFVIDAPCVYLAPGMDGHLVPEVMDGALIKPLLRVDGRTPPPPQPAFQQSIKGMPAVDYTSQELLYRPRNKRSYRIYGFSPVEQVLLTVQIALRRQVTQLEHYTAGSVPDAVANVPETWTTDNISEFQAYWDALMSGDSEQLRRLRFVPSGVGITELKANALKDDFDEWLGRIVCWCFSLSPQALSKQMNRATANTAKQSAQEEGLEPLKVWLKNLLDTILRLAFNAPELEATWKDEEITDPVQKATVISLLCGAKPLFTQDEGRAMYGMEPMTDEQKDELQPAPPPQLVPPDPNDPNVPPKPSLPPKPGEEKPEPGSAAEKVAKRVAATARRSLRP